MIFIVAILAFYLAWNLGANDVANAMGTSVGSKAVTLRQALVIAGILEFTGAVLFGDAVSQTLATEIVNPEVFAAAPQVLAIGMTSVLLACGVWMQIATARGWPVSSSHAVVGALAGFSAWEAGSGAIAWSSIRLITVAWILTPLVSGTIAALFYSLVKRFILDQLNQQAQLNEWIPWLSAALLSLFGAIALPTLSQPVYRYLHNELHLNIPAHDVPLAIGTLGAIALTFNSWGAFERGSYFGASQGSEGKAPSLNPIERQMGRYQLLSACFVAFAHGSNDVGNAIAPLATIAYINRTGTVPINGITIPLWILILGGAGIVGGLAVWGKNVIATVGENIIPLQPSGGFCAELATATTILLASRFGLPVSTTHALVGGVVGIGLVQNIKSIQLKTLGGIGAAWVITVPVSAALSAAIFAIAKAFL